MPAVSLDAELGHLVAPLGLNLTSQLLGPDDDELGRFQWSEADENVNDALIDIVLHRRHLVTYDEIGVL